MQGYFDLKAGVKPVCGLWPACTDMIAAHGHSRQARLSIVQAVKDLLYQKHSA